MKKTAVTITLVILLGVAGYLLFAIDNATSNSSQTQNTVNENKETVTETNKLLLAGGSVGFTLPEDWSYVKGDDKCRRDVLSDVKCLEGALVTPGVMLPTKYGNGTEFFNISFSVFENLRDKSPKNWFQEDFHQADVSDEGIENSEPINGYGAYYRKQITDVFHEITYVLSYENKIVLVVARTYEPATLEDGQEVGDFRQFEQPLEDIANTIVIN